MRSKYYYIGLLLLLLPALSFGQGNKTIKRNKVASQTTYEYFLAEGKKEPVIEKVETFDENGNVLETKEFNKSGEIRFWESYTYNENGDLVEQKSMDEKGRVEERIEYVYKEELIKEKRYFDVKGRLVKKKTYSYEFREE